MGAHLVAIENGEEENWIQNEGTYVYTYSYFISRTIWGWGNNSKYHFRQLFYVRVNISFFIIDRWLVGWMNG